jgi:hypothetical protein
MKLLTKEFSSLEVNGKDVMSIALEYLRQDGNGEYVVNIEKCVSEFELEG